MARIYNVFSIEWKIKPEKINKVMEWFIFYLSDNYVCTGWPAFAHEEEGGVTGGELQEVSSLWEP